MRHSFVAVVVLGVVAVSLIGTGTVDAQSLSDDVEVTVPENRFVAGEDGTFEVYVTNREIAPLRAVSVELDSERRFREDAPLEIRTAERPIGTVADTRGPVPFNIVVDEDAEPGEYTVEATVTYSEQVDDRTFTREVDTEFEVIVEERAEFEVVDVESDVQVGGSGPMTVTLNNTGTERARDPAVVLTSPDSEISFPTGSSATDSFAGDWEVGEYKTFNYTVEVESGTEPRPYTLRTVVEFRDNATVEHTSDQIRDGVTVTPEQGFETRDVQSDLRVGGDGVVEGELVNTGPENVSGAVVTFDSLNPNINARDPEYTVGDLGVGENATFRFEIGVSSSAEAGDRELPFVVRYRDRHGEVRTSRLVDMDPVVGPEPAEFEVEGIETDVPLGDEATVEVRVTNLGNRTLTDIQATAFTNRPLSSDVDEAFVEELGANESVTVRFRLSADRNAATETYPLSVDFRYDDERGESRLSDTYRVPVRVVEPEDGLPVVPIAVGVAVVAVLAAGWWWRRS